MGFFYFLTAAVIIVIALVGYLTLPYIVSWTISDTFWPRLIVYLQIIPGQKTLIINFLWSMSIPKAEADILVCFTFRNLQDTTPVKMVRDFSATRKLVTNAWNTNNHFMVLNSLAENARRQRASVNERRKSGVLPGPVPGQEEQEEEEEVEEQATLWSIFARLWQYGVSVFVIFAVTLSCYPAVNSAIVSVASAGSWKGTKMSVQIVNETSDKKSWCGWGVLFRSFWWGTGEIRKWTEIISRTDSTFLQSHEFCSWKGLPVRVCVRYGAMHLSKHFLFRQILHASDLLLLVQSFRSCGKNCAFISKICKWPLVSAQSIWIRWKGLQILPWFLLSISAFSGESERNAGAVALQNRLHSTVPAV